MNRSVDEILAARGEANVFNLSEETRKRLENAEEERQYLRNGYGKHKGFKFWKPDPEYHLWKIEKEDGSLGLAGHFTSAVACMQAIDEFLKEKEMVTKPSPKR